MGGSNNVPKVGEFETSDSILHFPYDIYPGERVTPNERSGFSFSYYVHGSKLFLNILEENM